MKLSIITINLNNKVGLEKTINSILSQTDQNFEYIVIDGSSEDGSLDLIKNTTRINHYLSEKDNGVYDAMNKGIQIANGDYLLFLNSGDYLKAPSTIENILPKLVDEDIIYGKLELESAEGNEVVEFTENLTFRTFISLATSLGHPSTFIKRSLFKKHGLYNTTYKIISDWAFFLQVIIKENASTKKIADTVSVFDLEGMSSLPSNRDKTISERNHFLNTNFPRFMSDYEQMTVTENTLNRIRSAKGFKWLKKLGVKKFQ